MDFGWLASSIEYVIFGEEKSIYHTESNNIENAICEVYLLSESRRRPLF